MKLWRNETQTEYKVWKLPGNQIARLSEYREMVENAQIKR